MFLKNSLKLNYLAISDNSWSKSGFKSSTRKIDDDWTMDIPKIQWYDDSDDNSSGHSN